MTGASEEQSNQECDQSSKAERWNDGELRVALDAYLYMLQLELSSVPFSAAEQSEVLLSGPLHKRNSASVRYRMRNISHVLGERGLPTLDAFSAAPQVGRNVTARLNALLDARSDTLSAIRHLNDGVTGSTGLSDVLQSLSELKERVRAIEGARKVGIGHNNPPDNIDLSVEEISEVEAAIDGISREVANGQHDPETVRTLSQRISAFGLKVTVWSGQRLSDFARAGAIAAGSGFGLSLSGLGEQIISTLRNLFQLIF